MAKSKSKLPVATDNICAGPSKREQRKWQAEDDIRTLQRAQEIKKDPERLKYAKECAADQAKALKSIGK